MSSILISGAASGIGAATARLFHTRGWRVGLLDVDEKALVAELGGAWHAPLDVVEAAAVKAALGDFCALSGGQLRLLFNGAGILRTGAFADIELEQHTRQVQINVLGVLNLCHAAYPYLKVTSAAQVINMGSASALYGVPQLASYSASKFAVRGLTEALELEWREYGIRVGDLMPPFVDTPMVRSQAKRPPVMRRLGVRLEAEQIAEAAWKQAHGSTVHRPVGLQFGLVFSPG
ncbi:short-chain dehydrogenase [Pseudomonas indoloxydans]|uniref:Short-chain dehydrogenase n=1 Tax=Ectopseudomonas oleovorans TaxID=301 RepID=A0A2T5PI52_ECTOL|nr:SDR family oxidoreductase [Pseudomonas indoloxydans]PTU77403.1 short-chain dehydrogenase [Pseudomonas indoloxydans]